MVVQSILLSFKEIADLNDQLQDLMRHLSIQSAVASSSEDTKKVRERGVACVLVFSIG